MFPNIFLFLFFFFILYDLSNAAPAATQSFLPIPNQSPPATIPAFPEQSNLAACPLNIPDDFFHAVKSACGNDLQKTRCCPVLAAWLYAAYSATALGRVAPVGYDMPMLPDDSETCVDDLGKALRERRIELVRPNETCDVVYCYCGIRLHPLSCPEAFYTDQKGKLVGDKRVNKLERDCLSSSTNVDRFPGLGGCSRCLNTLHLLNNGNGTLKSSKSDARTTRMHNRDCQLMGLTWLLAKNRTAYIHTVSAVLRAMLMNPGASNPRSCTIGSDGMPFAVDSDEISNDSVSITHQLPIYISLVLICSLRILLIARY